MFVKTFCLFVIYLFHSLLERSLFFHENETLYVRILFHIFLLLEHGPRNYTIFTDMFNFILTTTDLPLMRNNYLSQFLYQFYRSVALQMFNNVE